MDGSTQGFVVPDSLLVNGVVRIGQFVHEDDLPHVESGASETIEKHKHARKAFGEGEERRAATVNEKNEDVDTVGDGNGILGEDGGSGTAISGSKDKPEPFWILPTIFSFFDVPKVFKSAPTILSKI